MAITTDTAPSRYRITSAGTSNPGTAFGCNQMLAGMIHGISDSSCQLIPPPFSSSVCGSCIKTSGLYLLGPVCGEFQFRRQLGCEISRCNVAARNMTEGLRLAVEVRHSVRPA